MVTEDDIEIYNFSKYRLMEVIADNFMESIKIPYGFKVEEKIYNFFSWNGPHVIKKDIKNSKSKKKRSRTKSKSMKVKTIRQIEQKEAEKKSGNPIFTRDMATFDNIPDSILKTCVK